MSAPHDLDQDPELRPWLDALPRSIEPENDLWPGIATRLEPRASRARRPAWRSWALQALAAVLFMALGAGLERRLGGPAVPSASPEGDATAPAAAVAEAGDFRAVEADYLRAKEELWRAVVLRRDVLPRDRLTPETLEVVDRNLRLIDEAIDELHAALERDPGNPRLEELLLASHRQEMHLLQHLVSGADA